MYNSKGKVCYWSGSFAKIGIHGDQVMIHVTMLSYHKVLSNIEEIAIKKSFPWKYLNIKLDSGERVKIYIEPDQLKSIEPYLVRFNRIDT
ncbi:hypothetical protein [Catenovulum maritimum]|uniref:Uncharacterized protein n=1 Tax=Catenovulum maritimum TaxID=1513271 RepID=A0A0J8GLM5_9ALTE|nr:hypothetical protein [Catenovulum maritimum]KMT63710.1 hypothetical protein XM47_18320 [Catenovulum maritimum]